MVKLSSNFNVLTRVLPFLVSFKNSYIVPFAIGFDGASETTNTASYYKDVDTSRWLSFHLGVLDARHV